jgi:allantoinase
VDDFAAVGETDLRQALPILARRNVPLLVHAESLSLIGSSERLAFPESGARGSQPSVYATYLTTRPPEAELDAIRLMIRLAEEFRTRVHIVHVSSAEGVEAIAGAKAAWVPITAETCPHYLSFAAEDIPDGATVFKCAPPIRAAAHRDALWDGLGSGALDMIVTDHSPAPPALKTPGDFTHAWGGIASLELSLAATWTSLKSQLSTLSVESSELSALCSLARWMSAAPASLAGLGERKGRIAEGFAADLVVWDPDEAFTVAPARLRQRHKLTPYAGRSLVGTVHTTFVRGERVWDRNRLARAYGGRLL